VRADAAGTFGLHPLLQRFASEKLSSEGAARARDAHARFFLAELDGLGEAVGTERLERMASLGRAFEDVMAAWSWAAGWAAGPVSASVSASASASAVGLAAASQPVQAPTAGAPRWPAAELARL